jgi:hypothetical protein
MTSTSDDLDPVVDMVISSIGILEPNLFTPIAALDMCSLQSVFLPSSEDLLEAMIEFFPLTWCPSRALSSWKPRSRRSLQHGFFLSILLKNKTCCEDSFCISVETSLKNETEPTRIFFSSLWKPR